MIYKVITPVAINVGTATKERGDNLESPKTPWPEVQPDPRLAPNPSTTPHYTIIKGLICTYTVGLFPAKKAIKIDAVIMPMIIAKRHLNSPLSSANKVPDNIPVAPRVSPRLNIKITAPMSMAIAP